ncbi:peptidylprolyl cis-trans isomerase, cyclophilin-type [Syntrophotalea carbinolica DSM 2380]|uniref:Peptidyl-prolyl cis-trans isomerase n=1 Tax=Syntrophotalea carbinolica (strain DSM 2380 / NBRC 103641 / GraBd1) TaxID=338963 RepID=Q3A5N8_SYNC1|nr:peptidylprolyl isomerase [Syntrophotalea carbinolica]ABA88319.1 peptidylprolyl cis-trans isomerase, cyclophilin-type [Syntrophotalea carbinolica DSM 2380]
MSDTNPVARIETSQGTITVELDIEKAPVTVANFIEYAKNGFYENTIFHRVIPGFMIQGGGMTADMESKATRAPIKNEAANGLQNKRGTIAMARTQIVDSATAQFFINVVDNDFLNHQGPNPATFGYAVFGHVIEGMDIVDAIQQVSTGSRNGHRDVPVEPILIERITIID